MIKLKRQLIRVFISVFVIFSNSLFAEVLRPIQILLPGNIQGDLITFTEDQKAEPSEAFKLPYVVNDFFKLKDKDSIIFGLGNDSSLFKSFSYLNRGKVEREIIDRCNPYDCAVSPNDLEVFNDTFLDKKIKQRVFTNVEASDNNEIFKRYSLKTINNRNFFFFNFISPEYCKNLPLERWSQIKVDDPARALRKVNPNLTSKDYTISVVYGNKEVFDEITSELKKLNGIHFIINVPLGNEKPLFATTHLEDGNNNVFRFSVESGSKSLAILNIIQKNTGYPRTTLRMIPFNKYSDNKSKNDFRNAWNQVRQEFHKPLKVIPTTNRASTSANRISLQAHAEMLKYATNSEIAFIKLPNQISFRENVITVGDVITRFPNDRIIIFKASETQLKNMFNSLIKDSSIREFGFAGCNFLVLGKEFREFSINKQTIDKNRLYIVATTESTAKEFAVKNILKKSFVFPYEGQTLWTVWKNNLQSFKATDEYLFE